MGFISIEIKLSIKIILTLISIENIVYIKISMLTNHLMRIKKLILSVNLLSLSFYCHTIKEFP